MVDFNFSVTKWLGDKNTIWTVNKIINISLDSGDQIYINQFGDQIVLFLCKHSIVGWCIPNSMWSYGSLNISVW